MSKSTLEVKSLTKYFPLRGWKNRGKHVKAVDDISFSLERGKTLSIVGETGSGKSSLANQLVGADTPTSGQVFIHDQNVYQLAKSEQRDYFKKIRMVFQNPYSSLNPAARIETILEEPLKINTNMNAAERSAAIANALQRVGLRENHKYRFPHMFSGGQRQRIAIARALMLQPEVIVADEPLSALDVSVQAQILNLFMDLQEQLELSYVFISHDLGVVEHISDYVLVMYRGQLMEYGEVDQIFDAPKHPYTHKLLASTPTYRHLIDLKPDQVTAEFKKQAKHSDGCVFASRCPYATQHCLEQQPSIKEFAGQTVKCHAPLGV
ncbi:MAG: dipeptide ABC transporter ATP-binding protein [Kangiellaceae bacterium]|jgi:dipeptide transport system ATP-binding protein|nr:dipeptide ABC transporter ATP-binding protein [Kangiellaceae bacterium]